MFLLFIYQLSALNAETLMVKESQIRQQIHSYRTLGKNWDSYGAEPPSEIAIGHALDALGLFYGRGVLSMNVSPSSDEGIVLEFFVEGKFHLIEFYNDGDIVYVRRDDGQSYVFDI